MGGVGLAEIWNGAGPAKARVRQGQSGLGQAPANGCRQCRINPTRPGSSDAGETGSYDGTTEGLVGSWDRKASTGLNGFHLFFWQP